jgi:hypothetical protein
MGHTNDNTMSYYISGLVGIDSQSMVRGRAQRVELLDENCSMMARRNLLAPQPPGSQLVDQAFKPIESKTVSLVVLSPRQEYDMRRQRRNKMYVKTRKRFWENDGEELEEELKQDQALKLGAATSEVVEVKASLPQRLPSRYLKALWKHEPERRRLVELLYCNGVTDQGAELALDPILESLVNMANPPKKRYAYNSAQPGPDGSCGVCKQALPPYVYFGMLLLLSLTCVERADQRETTPICLIVLSDNSSRKRDDIWMLNSASLEHADGTTVAIAFLENLAERTRTTLLNT